MESVEQEAMNPANENLDVGIHLWTHMDEPLPTTLEQETRE